MRIAIVNDVEMAVEALRRTIETSPEHQIAWIARDGVEAVERCARDIPDLILMDLIMPTMGGVEATRRIMAETPCAILIVTATVEGNAAKVFEALGAGALDVVSTPVISQGEAGGVSALLSKIGILESLIRGNTRTALPKSQSGINGREQLIVFGASAGGPAALAKILGQLPADFPAAIVIVQHVDAQFAASMASWLDEQSDLKVRIAQHGDQVRAGEALLAGTDDHLVFVDSHTLEYSPASINSLYRPSINVFFESAARHGKGAATGVLLTGMGRDGAKGLKCLRDAGAVTIAQNCETCIVYGMPKAAVEIDAASEVLPLDEITPRLIKLCSRHLK